MHTIAGGSGRRSFLRHTTLGLTGGLLAAGTRPLWAQGGQPEAQGPEDRQVRGGAAHRHPRLRAVAVLPRRDHRRRGRLGRRHQLPRRAADRRGDPQPEHDRRRRERLEHRAAVAPDVPVPLLQRHGRRRAGRHQRHRHRALRHRRQEARRAGLPAARRQGAAAPARLRQRLDGGRREEPGGLRGADEGAGRQGLHRLQVRSVLGRADEPRGDPGAAARRGGAGQGDPRGGRPRLRHRHRRPRAVEHQVDDRDHPRHPGLPPVLLRGGGAAREHRRDGRGAARRRRAAGHRRAHLRPARLPRAAREAGRADHPARHRPHRRHHRVQEDRGDGRHVLHPGRAAQPERADLHGRLDPRLRLDPELPDPRVLRARRGRLQRDHPGRAARGSGLDPAHRRARPRHHDQRRFPEEARLRREEDGRNGEARVRHDHASGDGPGGAAAMLSA